MIEITSRQIETPKLRSASGLLYSGTNPIICGTLSSPPSTNHCYLFENGNWSEMAHLNIDREDFLMSTFILQNKYKLLASGGYKIQGRQYVSTVEYFDGSNWTVDQHFSLPEAIADHCIVNLNHSLLMLMGGGNSTDFFNKTWLFNTLKGRWMQGPDLLTSRSHHSCGLMNWLNPKNQMREKVVVVAGGYFEGVGIKTATVELLFLSRYDLFQNGWVEGPILPSSTASSLIIEFQNGLTIVGGDWENSNRHFYQLSTPSGPWAKMSQFIKEPPSLTPNQKFQIAFMVPDDITKCY